MTKVTAGGRREGHAGILAKAEIVKSLPQRLGRHRLGHLGGADIARLAQDAGQIEHAVIAEIADRIPRHAHVTGAGVDTAARIEQALIHGRGQGEGLDRRAWLEDIGNSAVAPRRGGTLAALIGVVGRPVGQGQHFAAAGIQQHDATGPGAVLANGGRQAAIGQILQAHVDAGDDIRAGAGSADLRDVLDHFTLAITDYLALARNGP